MLLLQIVQDFIENGVRFLIRSKSDKLESETFPSLMKSELSKKTLSGLPIVNVYPAIIIAPTNLSPSRRPPTSPSQSKNE